MRQTPTPESPSTSDAQSPGSGPSSLAPLTPLSSRTPLPLESLIHGIPFHLGVQTSLDLHPTRTLCPWARESPCLRFGDSHFRAAETLARGPFRGRGSCLEE